VLYVDSSLRGPLPGGGCLGVPLILVDYRVFFLTVLCFLVDVKRGWLHRGRGADVGPAEESNVLYDSGGRWSLYDENDRNWLDPIDLWYKLKL
jgi:hypothetical protein